MSKKKTVGIVVIAIVGVLGVLFVLGTININASKAEARSLAEQISPTNMEQTDAVEGKIREFSL